MQITAKTPQDRIKRQSVVANANASSGCCRSFPSNGNYPPPPCLQLTDGSWLRRGSDGYRLHSALLLQGSAGSAADLQPGQGQQDKVRNGEVVADLRGCCRSRRRPLISFCFFDSFGWKRKAFAEQELNLRSDEKEKRERGKRR